MHSVLEAPGAWHRAGTSLACPCNVAQRRSEGNTETHFNHLCTGLSPVYDDAMQREPEPVARKTVALPRSVWDEVSEYRFTERIGTEAEALRRLLLVGLRQVAKEKAL